MYEDLETVANLRFGKMVEQVSREREAELSKTIAELSSRGLANSGPMTAARLKIYIWRNLAGFDHKTKPRTFTRVSAVHKH